jgi:hypothetical protein
MALTRACEPAIVVDGAATIRRLGGRLLVRRVTLHRGFSYSRRVTREHPYAQTGKTTLSAAVIYLSTPPPRSYLKSTKMNTPIQRTSEHAYFDVPIICSPGQTSYEQIVRYNSLSSSARRWNPSVGFARRVLLLQAKDRDSAS